MLQYKANVRIGGSMNHVQAGKLVTIAEIAVLRHVHGTDAVDIVGKGPPVERTDADERDRLRKRYDNPTPDSVPLVDRLFGGPLGALPTKLSAIGVDPRAQAAAIQAQAAAMLEAAAALEDQGLEDGDAEIDELFPEPAEA